jgi:ABC-type amino acid transport substrate-binding protein
VRRIINLPKVAGNILLAVIFSLVTPSLSAQIQEPLQINVPRLDVKVDPNETYIQELLKQIIFHSPRPYKLVPTQGRMLQGRSIYEMTKANGSVDIMWSMTTDEREKKLIPIRIPVEKGLIGWRIGLITSKMKKAFANIKKLDDLKPYTAGQGINWPDVDILKANHLTVLTSNAYDPLFAMLEAGRFDYFPRSIFEIWGDVANHHQHQIEVEQNFVLHYPTACYFFITPRRPILAEDLRIGFEKIIANGIFERLFQKYHQTSIERANLKQRTVIHLKNPLLTPTSMPMHRPELWFQAW